MSSLIAPSVRKQRREKTARSCGTSGGGKSGVGGGVPWLPEYSSGFKGYTARLTRPTAMLS